MPSIADLFNNVLSSIGQVLGSGPQSNAPQGGQGQGQAQPQQGGQGTQAPAGPQPMPSPGVAQAGGVPGSQPQAPVNPLLAQLTQPPSNFDTALKYLLPLVAGFAAESQESSEAGPVHRIGAALGGGANALLQERNTAAQQQLARAQLLNTMNYQQATLGQKQQAIDINKAKLPIEQEKATADTTRAKTDVQKADYETKPAGIDMAASYRSDPEMAKNLPDAETMKGLPQKLQIEAIKAAGTMSKAGASLAETHEAHQALQQNRADVLDFKIQDAQARHDDVQARITQAEQAHVDTTDLKKQQLDIQKQMLDLNKQKADNDLEMKKTADDTKKLIASEANDIKVTQGDANRLVKARQNYDAHWHYTSFEDYAKSVGIDPDSGAVISKGKAKVGTDSTSATGPLGAP